jgi:hypothetical protein
MNEMNEMNEMNRAGTVGRRLFVLVGALALFAVAVSPRAALACPN